MISDDDKLRAGNRQKTIQPISSDVPAASVNVPTADLEEIRKKIEEINSGPKSADSPVVIEQQQSIKPEQYQEFISSQAVPENKKSPAVKLIRSKLAKLYAKEPDAVDEAIEAFQAQSQRSKHQRFMLDLTTSGKGLAEIQTAWHNYYVSLPDSEKHEVWQEFYTAHNKETQQLHTTSHPGHHTNTVTKHKKLSHSEGGTHTQAELKKRIVSTVTARGKLSARHHFQSLLFGIGIASVVMVLFLFSFFNERFLAPFMSPSRQVSATPIVGNTGTVGPEPKIIIPKINLEVPVVYGIDTTDEKTVQKGLEDGVVHYSTTPMPGQNGNVVIVGHSSNNILNKGKYKFAFVLLRRLQVGDTFSINKDGIHYTYQIYETKVVKATDVSVLGDAAKPNSATLITCDPPGTSVNRLVVVGEQISPDPAANQTVQKKEQSLTSSGVLPSNAPSLWQRIKDAF